MGSFRTNNRFTSLAGRFRVQDLRLGVQKVMQLFGDVLNFQIPARMLITRIPLDSGALIPSNHMETPVRATCV